MNNTTNLRNVTTPFSRNTNIKNSVVLIHKRFFLHDGPDTVEELLDRHVAKKDKSTTSLLDDDEEEIINQRRLTSTRREALALYRDIIRATRFFVWTDPRGAVWRDVLRANARKEFEEARFERDPEVITRLLIGGRDAVQSALDKLAEKQRHQIENERHSRGYCCRKDNHDLLTY